MEYDVDEGNTIASKHIGRADIEHYYGGIVLTVAQQLTNRKWDLLRFPARQKLLDKAVDIVYEIMNNPRFQNSLRIWLTH